MASAAAERHQVPREGQWDAGTGLICKGDASTLLLTLALPFQVSLLCLCLSGPASGPRWRIRSAYTHLWEGKSGCKCQQSICGHQSFLEMKIFQKEQEEGTHIQGLFIELSVTQSDSGFVLYLGG